MSKCEKLIDKIKGHIDARIAVILRTESDSDIRFDKMVELNVLKTLLDTYREEVEGDE